MRAGARGRPGRLVPPLAGAHHEDPDRLRGRFRGDPADVLVQKGQHVGVQVDQRVRAEVDLAQLPGRVDRVAPRPHQQPLPGPPGRGHGREVGRGADLLVVVPARDVQHRQVQLADAVLVADWLPPLVQRGVPDFLPPVGRDEPGRLVHRQQRPVRVDRHPVRVPGVLDGPPVGHPEPVHAHRVRHPGRPLHERVARRDQADHGLEGGGPVQCGQPLDPPRVAASVRDHLAVAPVLGRDPVDDVGPVRPVVAVRHEAAVGVAAAAHVHQDVGVPAPRERLGPGRLPFPRPPVRRPHDHGRGRALPRQHHVRGERDPVPQWDPEVKSACHPSLSHESGWYREIP